MHLLKKETGIQMHLEGRPRWGRQSTKRDTKGYNRGTPDLYPHQTEKFFLFLTIRPRFVGRAARPRAATLPIE